MNFALTVISGLVVSMLQSVYYVAVIIVSFKAVQALNIYINKNSK